MGRYIPNDYKDFEDSENTFPCYSSKLPWIDKIKQTSESKVEITIVNDKFILY